MNKSTFAPALVLLAIWLLVKEIFGDGEVVSIIIFSTATVLLVTYLKLRQATAVEIALLIFPVVALIALLFARRQSVIAWPDLVLSVIAIGLALLCLTFFHWWRDRQRAE